MTFDEFIKKYDSKGIDFDGRYGYQCFDLYRQYCQEVLNIPQSPAVVGAKDIWTTYLKDRFDAIVNTPTGLPQKGDILIWGKEIGEFGHVGIFIDGDISKFNSFDQNFPVGTLCHKQLHSYKGVLGWLRIKQVNPLVVEPKYDLGDLGVWERQKIVSTIKDQQQALQNNAKTIQDQQRAVEILDDQKKVLTGRVELLQAQVSSSIGTFTKPIAKLLYQLALQLEG